MKRPSLLFRTIALSAVLAFSAPALGHDDAGSIRHVLMQMFDRPEKRMTVEPITVEDDIAVAGWAQGGMGGRALMRRKDHRWQIVLRSGDALKEAHALQQFGVTTEQAKAMAKAVVAAEAKLDLERRGAGCNCAGHNLSARWRDHSCGSSSGCLAVSYHARREAGTVMTSEPARRIAD